MESYENVMAYQRAKIAMNKVKNATCKNGNFILEKDKTKLEFTAVNSGCNNPRRDGSAWCGNCANLHHSNKNW